MKTKKSFILILFLMDLFTTELNAQQNRKEGITFAVIVGGNLNKFTGKNYYEDNIKGHKFFPGFHVGANVEIPVFSGFFLQSGLQLVKKGSKLTDDFFIGGKFTSTYNLYYVELPIKLVFKPQVGKGKLIVGIGPDIALGVGGKWKRDTENYTAYDVNGKVKFNKTIPSNADPYDLYLKPLEVSASAFVGYEFTKNIFFQLNGQLGLTDIYVKRGPNDPNDKTKLKNLGFGLSLGYRFRN